MPNSNQTTIFLYNNSRNYIEIMYSRLNILEAIFLLFIIHLVQVPSSNADKGTNRMVSRAEVPFAKKQLQIIGLFNNLICLRKEETELAEISENFDPLQNLNLYTNPDVVKEFFDKLQNQMYAPRLAPTDFDSITPFYDIIWRIEDWDVLYKTLAYTSQRMNIQAFIWALGGLLANQYRNFKIPPNYEIIPQQYTPKEITQKANGDQKQSPVNQFADSDPEILLEYLRADPAYSQFHLNWHVDFPFLWNDELFGFAKERRGELFLYMHHNLAARYRAARLSNKMKQDTTPLNFMEPIAEGYIPMTLNPDGSELPSREPNSRYQDVSGVNIKDLIKFQDRILQSIKDGYLVNTNGGQVSLLDNGGNDYLGDTFESANQTVNYDFYGDLHNEIHISTSLIGHPTQTDNPGAVGHIEQSVQDPAFYKIHYYTDYLFNQAQQYKLPPYNGGDFQLPGIVIQGVEIGVDNIVNSPWTVPVLTTYLEDFTYEITNSIKDCEKVNSGTRYNATIKRLNYKPFDYKIAALSFNSLETKGIVRIYMSPVNGFDGKPYSRQELYWNMFEMDRFPITLNFGLNKIQRSSLNSSLTIPTRPGFSSLTEEVNTAVRENGKLDPYPINMTRLCGWPQHLLLPRGTSEGMKFKLFVMISSASTGFYDENEFPQLPLCGNPSGKFPDGAPMGFPFNRKGTTALAFPGGFFYNHIFTDLIIKHQSGV